jgi:phosphate transport system substrate-binding protein
MKKLFLIFIMVFGFILYGCTPGSLDNQNIENIQTETLENIGSDTMVNLALAWAETYQNLYPDTLISVTGGGSGTGIAALINGTADIANASRGIKDEEISTANENGIEPIQHIVARDAIAVIINPENPINRLTLEQVSDIYSGKINNWAELGGENRPIVRLSRETNSGTHVYFLEEVLRLGDKDNKTLFSRDTLLLPSSEGITTEVRDNPNAIGYDGLGYVTEDVKVLAIAAAGTEDYILPSYETVNNNLYPIARDLFMYTAGEPKGNIKQFIEWIFSDEAQGIVLDLGFIPVR